MCIETKKILFYFLFFVDVTLLLFSNDCCTYAASFRASDKETDSPYLQLKVQSIKYDRMTVRT